LLTVQTVYKLSNLRRINMPITTIKIVRGVFSEEQKSAMIQGVTEAMVKVTGEEKRDGNWVLIEETNPGEWAIGGKPVGLP
jgi:4-oxalocrotonate tautomerase